MSDVELNGGQLAARTLTEAGVEVIFGLHGGHLDSFLVGCAEEGIRVVDARHEAAAVNAADGYARTTGGLGVAVVTSGPGLTNGLAGITNAAADGIPLLVITSSSPIRELETRELQGGLDLIAMLTPVCKWCRKVLAAERTPDIVSMAIRKALAESGPVIVDIPIDVAFTPVPPDRLVKHGPPVIGDRPTASKDAIEKAAKLIESAERPVAIVGELSMTSQLRDPVRRFAEQSNTPVFTSTLAPHGLPSEHELNGGSTRMIPLIGEEPDLVILVGARQGMFLGGRSGALIPPGAKVVQLDTDPVEIGRLYPADCGVIGEVGASLDALAASRNWSARAEWVAKASSAKHISKNLFSSAGMEPDGIHPARAAKDAVAVLPSDIIVILDGGEAAIWASMALVGCNPYAVLSLGYQGHLGVGQGYAIGAQIAHPDKRVIQFAGDGAIAFHCQEWDTMVRHGLPIVTIVLNNACWGMSLHGQEAVYGKGNDVISKLSPTRYDLVGQGFGTHAEHAESIEEVGPAVERALSSGLPAVVNLSISGEVVHPATNNLLGDINATDEIVVPYYQNLPK